MGRKKATQQPDFAHRAEKRCQFLESISQHIVIEKGEGEPMASFLRKVQRQERRDAKREERRAKAVSKEVKADTPTENTPVEEAKAQPEVTQTNPVAQEKKRGSQPRLVSKVNFQRTLREELRALRERCIALESRVAELEKQGLPVQPGITQNPSGLQIVRAG